MNRQTTSRRYPKSAAALLTTALVLVLFGWLSPSVSAQVQDPQTQKPPSPNQQRDLDSDIAVSAPSGLENTKEQIEAPAAPEPVFSLGIQPFLPPPSWTEEDAREASSDLEKLNQSNSAEDENENEGNSEQDSDNVDSTENPPPVTTSPTADSSLVNSRSETSTPGQTNITTVTLESGLVLAAPVESAPTPTITPPAPAVAPVIEAPLPAETPKISQPPATSPTWLEPEIEVAPIVVETEPQQIVPTPVATPSTKARQPVMEQVDVTAKRLPPPDPFEAPDSGFAVSSAPPPGFEDLAQSQTTLVDIVYSKRVIASVMATFDMGMLEFLNPAEILEAIPDAKDDLALLNALTGPLDTHADALCYSDYDTECGRLTPEIAAVIFDETRFRAELFINPGYLETNYLSDSIYLPRSDSGTASVHSFSMSANGDERNQVTNLSASSLVSYRESRIESQYDIDSNDGLSIETLSLKHDARGWEYEAGAFRSRIQSAGFLTEQNIVGARVATSLNTRTDLRFAEATPLFAFLEQRSRVDILRGDQLLDSQFYGAGNQQLDTSRLPDGAYNVTVRVVENDGLGRDTEYYFARTSALPPKDQPLYFAEAGQLALTRQGVLPELSDSYWLRAGTAHRLRDDFGVEAIVSAIGDSTLIEGGFVWFQPDLQLQATLLAGDTTGVSLRSVWQRDHFALSADVRRIVSDSPITEGGIDVLPGAYTQANLTASFPLYDGRFLARARWDKRGSRDFQSLGINYARELKRFARSTLSMNVDTTISSDDSIVRLGVDWRWRDKNRDALVRPRVQYASNSGSADVLLGARYNTTLRNDDEGTYRASAFVDRAVERSVIGTRLSGENARGTGEVELQYGFEGEQTGAAYVANARFGVVSSGKQFAFGGRRTNTASIIIEIDGNAPEAVFEVIIDRQSHGYAQSGTRTIIALAPYETYDVRLAARGNDFVEFDQAPNSVTLYPGNVHTLNFTANRQIVVVGQVVDEEGHTIAHHTFTDLEGFASTDENGWFQIEVTDDAPLTLKRGDASICKIELALGDSPESLVVLDQLICR